MKKILKVYWAFELSDEITFKYGIALSILSAVHMTMIMKPICSVNEYQYLE